ncbi:peptidoglycan-binding domain-containing protein [Streptomyces sp. AC512_CC834]|uniref:peptidoglycan-binding domain-containing protein n=1 Tax=Streptomyces sp. AC512_CC834 TaxID=2823691 RepID=UPI001C25A566|nr:peptidoglycan-binding domain-containing protein [Streptomyces sp. AC512_CC834]
MRALTKSLVGLTAAAGIAVGGLATAGRATAGTATSGTAAASAPESAQQRAVGAEAVAPLAVVNLGLNTARAKSWQCWLRNTGYDPGAIDGQLGTQSWKAAQRKFEGYGFYDDSIDGIVGPNTIIGLQHYLNVHVSGLNLAADGIAGPATKKAFWDFARTDRC